MIVHKSTCGMCKPRKKFKRNNTKLKGILLEAISNEELSINLIESYEKQNRFN